MALRFRLRKLDDDEYEAASVCDVDGDGVKDIVCGGYWYKGPDFREKIKICDVRFDGETEPCAEGYRKGYYDDFADYPMDVNGDGRTDIVTGSWNGETLRWRENPGVIGEPWPVHDIKRVGNIEIPLFFDIDGDGEIEMLPNCPNEFQSVFKLLRTKDGKGSGIFEEHVITDRKMGHGLGFGDINMDGRAEIIASDGWYEQPEDGPYAGMWKFHPDFMLTSPDLAVSCPILVHDVNGDGLPDLIYANCHRGYGLVWMEQVRDKAGRVQWFKHAVDMDSSQLHNMVLADIDNDGVPELVTGKRYKAHNGNDDGTDDDYGIYYYKINGGEFEKHTIVFGGRGETTGVGIFFWVEDVTGNGYPDIIAPGKDGLWLIENLGEN